MEGSRDRGLVIIPCFNEARNVGPLLSDIQQLNLPFLHTLVIDDESVDETQAEARKYSKCIRLVKNLGIGGAVQTGLIVARNNDYGWAIQVDGDGQHPPDQIQKMFEHFEKTKADIVIGSRFVDESSFRSTFRRRIGIRLISDWLKLLYKKRFTDPTSGFRIYGPRAIELFHKEYPIDFPEPVTIALALNHGLRIEEVGVQMKAREFGRSSISGIKQFTYIIRVLGYIFIFYLRKRGV